MEAAEVVHREPPLLLQSRPGERSVSQPTRQVQVHLGVDDRAERRGAADPRTHQKVVHERWLRHIRGSAGEVVQGDDVFRQRALVANRLEPGTIAVQAPGQRYPGGSVYPGVLDRHAILLDVKARDGTRAAAAHAALPDRRDHDGWLERALGHEPSSLVQEAKLIVLCRPFPVVSGALDADLSVGLTDQSWIQPGRYGARLLQH